MYVAGFVIVALFSVVVSAVPIAPQHPKESGTGAFTFFEPGLGACGEENKPSDLIVAVSSQVFDSL